MKLSRRHVVLIPLLVAVGGADSAVARTQAVAASRQEGALAALAADDGWLALGHWRPSFLGGWRSDIDAGAFFLAADGRESPAAELVASLKAMATGSPVGPRQLPAPCALPARATFLRQHGWPIARVDCPNFAAFRSKLAVRSAALIFASAYANNPASMFGHVVLRLDHRGKPDESSPMPLSGAGAAPYLLDNSVAFLAQIGSDDDPFSYAYKGLSGGYPGTYMIDPYYVTVATYNDGESRDLWEYDLDLSEAEISLLVEHLWEVTMLAHFPYFFAHGNCAYQILSLIAVARPAAHLLESTGPVVLPLEVARQLHEQLGTSAAVRWRPSLKRQLKTGLDRLNDAQRQRFDQWRRSDAGVAEETSPLVIDALIAYLNYRKFDSHNRLNPRERQAFRAALVRRSQLGVSADDAVDAERPTAPDAGHLPAQVRLGGGMRQTEGFTTLGVKGGLHDFLSADRGYESFAAIDYLEAAVRFQAARRRLLLDHFTVVAVNSLAPFDLVSKDWSWRAGLTWQQIAERPSGGVNAQQLRGELGAGLTWGFFEQHLAFYHLALVGIDASAAFYHGMRCGPGLALGLTAQWGMYHLLGEWTARRDFIHGEDSRRWSLGQSLTFGRGWDLRVDLMLAAGRKVARPQREAQLTLAYSF